MPSKFKYDLKITPLIRQHDRVINTRQNVPVLTLFSNSVAVPKAGGCSLAVDGWLLRFIGEYRRQTENRNRLLNDSPVLPRSGGGKAADVVRSAMRSVADDPLLRNTQRDLIDATPLNPHILMLTQLLAHNVKAPMI